MATVTTLEWTEEAYDPAACCCVPSRCTNFSEAALYFQDFGAPGPSDWRYAVLVNGADLPNAPGTGYVIVLVDGARASIELSVSTAQDVADYGYPNIGNIEGDPVDFEDDEEGHDWFSGFIDIPTNLESDVTIPPNELAIEINGANPSTALVCLDSFHDPAVLT